MIKNGPKRIVVFRTDRIGEVLLSTVAIDILKSNFPQAEITFVTSRYSAGLLRTRDDLAEIICIDPIKKSTWLWQAFKLSQKLRQRSFDMAVVLNAHKIWHMAVFMAGIPKRCGYDRKWPFLLTHRVMDRRDQAQMHEVEYTKEFFRGLGMKVSDAQPSLHVEDGLIDLVKANLQEQGISFQRPVVVLHPCASNPLKFWSEQKYAGLLHRLKDNLCQIIVIGEEREHGSIAEIIADSGCPAVNAAGMFTLEELGALLSASSLFIGNDSGPMHMAAVLGVPVVAIFSKKETGSNPARWRPWGDDHVIFHELYGEKPCKLTHFSGYYIAKNDIAVSDVIEMVVDKLESRENDEN